jgi:hypothetical protein
MPSAVDGQISPRRGHTARGRPDHQMRRSGRDHLLASRATVGLARALARDASDQKIALARAVRFLAAEWGGPALGGFGFAHPAATSGTVPAH